MRVAIAGLKGHQGVAVEGLGKLEWAKLVAVADDEPERLASANGWATVLGQEVAKYADWREMLDAEQPDVLVEAGVDSERADVICTALERGISVLAEKPLAKDLAGLSRVEAALNRSSAHLSMLLTMRYEPIYRTVRQAVGDGAIGTVCLASMQKSYRLGQRPQWQRSRETFSGIIPFIGIHALDLVVWTTGLRPIRGFAFHANTGHPEIGDMEDNAVVALELSNGAHACLRLDYCRPAMAPTHGDDRLRLAGSEGVIEAWGTRGKVSLVTNEREPEDIEIGTCPPMFVEFAEAIRRGKEPPITADDCLTVTEWVLKLRSSANTGRPVQL